MKVLRWCGDEQVEGCDSDGVRSSGDRETAAAVRELQASLEASSCRRRASGGTGLQRQRRSELAGSRKAAEGCCSVYALRSPEGWSRRRVAANGRQTDARSPLGRRHHGKKTTHLFLFFSHVLSLSVALF
ncbi:hypothetical protein ACJRO7_016498 [Eucalyptus globulus]|uniref:Uncharacterized protein n=1 Tax=Eucalyptus globulus TaxID=34317 RepID=A0ABD3L8C8_EUCGL